MTDVDITPLILPELADLAPLSTSTPMQRAANQLQKVLPPGWQVEVVAAPLRSERRGQPALRLIEADL
ncbi:hypothetical protein [Nocardia sp. NPDC057668]|uniref:hypothetical protein n=1 Tax=Nocardia sp. NPDC057668 TaxID=3346202 RepID=UPI003670DD13